MNETILVTATKAPLQTNMVEFVLNSCIIIRVPATFHATLLLPRTGVHVFKNVEHIRIPKLFLELQCQPTINQKLGMIIELSQPLNIL